MLKKKSLPAFILFLVVLQLCAVASASIKVSNDDCPVFISSHIMGNQIIQHPNGFQSINGTILGFASAKFPVTVNFKTLTHFISTIRYQTDYVSAVLSDGTGKNELGRSDFKLLFDRPGSTVSQVISWNVAFPAEGFYAFNIFIDGKLVGYYPFYVWTRY